MRKLDFIIIGGQRCGTTWLYKALKNHPDIFLPQKKELHFFDRQFEKGLDFYHANFSNAYENQILGEATPDYLCREHVPSRVHEYSPEMKLIVIFRNPVDRAYSSFQMFHEFFKGHSFESALQEFPGLVRCGKYITHANRWLELFPREQFKFILFEDMMENEEKVIDEVIEFLGVKPLQTSLLKKNHVVNAPMFPRLQRWLYAAKLDWIIELVKKTPMNHWLRERYVERKKNSSSTINTQTRAQLIDEFKPFNDDLARLLKRDLSIWN